MQVGGRIASGFGLSFLLACFAHAGVTADSVGQFLAPKSGDPLAQEWLKLKSDLIGTIPTHLSQPGSVASPGNRYKVRSRVQHAPTQVAHQRFDSYLINVAPSGAREAVPTIEAQVTFSRLYASAADAESAPLLFLNRFPWTAFSALQLMQPGDAVRLEVATDGSLAREFSKSDTTAAGSRTRAKRGDRLTTDLYRLQDDRIRMRITSFRETAGLTGDIGLDATLKLGAALTSLSSSVGVFTNCVPIETGAGANLEVRPPLETMQIEFVFNLSTPTGIEAYEETLKSLATLRFETHFRLLRHSDRVENVLLKYTGFAEVQFRSERSIEPQLRSVDRPFKGLALTQFLNSSITSGCFEVWNTPGTTQTTLTKLRIYDENEIASDSLFVKSAQDRPRVTTQILMTPNESTTESTAALAEPPPLELADYTFTRELPTSALRAGDVQKITAAFKYQFPRFALQIDWSRLEQPEARKQAFANWTFVFHQSTFEALPRLSKNEVLQDLREFIEHHPDRDSLLLPMGATQTLPLANNLDLAPTSEREVSQLAAGFTKILNSDSVFEATAALAKMQHQRLMQEVGVGFLMSLLPSEMVDSLVHMDFTFVAPALPVYNLSTEAVGETPRTKAVQSLLLSLGDNSFDLGLQLREKREKTTPSKTQTEPRL